MRVGNTQMFSTWSVSSAYESDGTTKGNEIHLWAIDEFFGEDFADGEGDFGLVFVLVADGDAVLVAVAAGGAEGMHQLKFYRRHSDVI